MDRAVHTAFNLFILGLSIVCMLYSKTFQYPTSAYMLGVFGLLGASGLFNLLILARQARATAGTSNRKEDARPFIDKKAALGNLLILAYVALIPVTGFYVTSLIYFVTWVLAFCRKRAMAELRTALGVAAVSIVIVYVLFSYLLNVPAPEGIFI